MNINILRLLVTAALLIGAVLLQPSAETIAQQEQIAPKNVIDLNLKFPFQPGSEWQVTAGWEAPNHQQAWNWYAVDFVPFGRSCLGEPVLAAAHGWIEANDGHGIQIDHRINNYRSLYAHLDTTNPSLTIGTEVFPGQQIGTCGGYPNFTPHLHFQVYQGPWSAGGGTIPVPINDITQQDRLKSNNRGLFSTNILDIMYPNGNINSPIDGSAISGSSFIVTASATDNSGGSGVDRVEFKVKYNDIWSSQPICISITSPYSCTIDTTNMNDQYINVAIDVIDRAGNRAIDAGGLRTFQLDRLFPNGNISSPVDGSAISGSSFIVTASAADNPGGSGIDGVEFKVKHNGTWASQPVCVTTISPYSCTIDTTNMSDQYINVAIDVIDRAGNRAIDAGGLRTFQLDRTNLDKYYLFLPQIIKS